jgi:hypothetical protein
VPKKPYKWRNLEVVKDFFQFGDILNQLDMHWFLLLSQDCSKKSRVTLSLQPKSPNMKYYAIHFFKNSHTNFLITLSRGSDVTGPGRIRDQIVLVIVCPF